MMLSGWMRLSLTSQVVDDLRELLDFLCVDSLIGRAVWQSHLLSEVSFSLGQIWKSPLNHDTAAVQVLLTPLLVGFETVTWHTIIHKLLARVSESLDISHGELAVNT